MAVLLFIALVTRIDGIPCENVISRFVRRRGTVFSRNCGDVKKESLRDARSMRVVGVPSVDSLSRTVHLGRSSLSYYRDNSRFSG